MELVEPAQLGLLTEPQPGRASPFVVPMRSSTPLPSNVNATRASILFKEDAVSVKTTSYMNPLFKTVSQSAEPMKFTPSGKEDAFAEKTFT